MKATTTKSKSTSASKSATAKKSTASAGPKSKVKAKSSAAEGLTELFEEQLKDIYWAEKALTKALPKMAKNAQSENLVKAIEEHLKVTENQVSRVEKVFEIMGKKASAKKCEAMEGLIKEGESILEDTEPGPVGP